MERLEAQHLQLAQKLVAVETAVTTLDTTLKNNHAANVRRAESLMVWVRWGIGIVVGTAAATNVHLARIFHQ